MADGARVGDGVVLGAGVTVGSGSTVERAVVFDGAEIGAGCTLRDCVVGAGARVGDGTRVEGNSMLGDGVRVGAGNVDHQRRAAVPGRRHPRRRHPLLMAQRLDAAACSAVDSTGQFAETLDLGVHLEDALWRVDSAAIAPVDAHGGLIVAGMGGSSVGGRLASAVLGPQLRRPFALAMGYDIPAWIGSETLVLCSSYSGTTEETVATYDAAKAAGAPRIVATTGGPLAERARADGVPVVPLPGGFQPRAAVGYSLVTALEAAALCGAAPSVRDDVARRRALARELAAEWGPGAPRTRRPSASPARSPARSR